jgi:hypothetical protein
MRIEMSASKEEKARKAVANERASECFGLSTNKEVIDTGFAAHYCIALTAVLVHEATLFQ